MRTHIAVLTATLAALGPTGCTTLTVKHVVDPIFAEVTINIHIQEQLKQVFDFETPRGQTEQPTTPPSGGQP